MKFNTLGNTDIKVSEICLGTMTWGSQNSQAEAHQQLDYAIGEGINFIDTAEMYPTTPRLAETTGLTEQLLGTWLKTRADRDRLVVATKITGEGNKDVRQGARVTGSMIREALEQSLTRLQTDVIDLYQLHWPNRGSYHFRKYWTFDPTNLQPGGMEQEVADILGEVQDLQREGKLRTFGLSNESAWGTMKFLDVAARHGLPRIVSVQNEYSLICRVYDTDMAELSHLENVGLMAFSPLAAGALSGKYLDGAMTPGTRGALAGSVYRSNEFSEPAIRAYIALAKKHDLDVCQMALAFCLAKPFMTSVIIGATTMEQLKTDIGATNITLDEEVVDGIQDIHKRYPRTI